MPIEESIHIPLRERHIGAPILAQPTAEQERQLKTRLGEELIDSNCTWQIWSKFTARISEVSANPTLRGYSCVLVTKVYRKKNRRNYRYLCLCFNSPLKF